MSGIRLFFVSVGPWLACCLILRLLFVWFGVACCCRTLCALLICFLVASARFAPIAFAKRALLSELVLCSLDSLMAMFALLC